MRNEGTVNKRNLSLRNYQAPVVEEIHETEKPITTEITYMATVLDVAISGNADERTLKILGQQVRDDIAALPGVSQVELMFARPYEIAIEVSEQTLRRHGLTLAEVGRAIEETSIDVPGGSLKTQGGEILLRTKGQAYRGRDILAMLYFCYPNTGAQPRRFYKQGHPPLINKIANQVSAFFDQRERRRINTQSFPYPLGSYFVHTQCRTKQSCAGDRNVH